MNALVTAIGSFSADIVIKGLKQMGFNVVGCDIYPQEWIVDAGQVNKFYQAPLATKEDIYIEFIQEICRKEDINYILPLTDVEVDVFNKYRKYFRLNDICLCISSKETLDVCRNKKVLETFVNENLSIHTIPTKMLSECSGKPSAYPVVCKPYDGRSSQGLKYIHDNDEWAAFVKTADKSKYIVQPYIEGNIVTVDVVRQPKQEKTVAIARKELLRTLNGAGTSVYVFNDEKLKKDCIDLANSLNICGCVNFEFILDSQGIYHFIECNPRFSGGVEFSCIAGYDCVRNHMNCFLERDIDDNYPIHNQYICRKYEEFVTRVE